MSSSASVKVSSRYYITLPQRVRRRLKIKSGDRLLVDVRDGMLILMPEPQSYTRSLAGLHREIWGKADEYIARERNAWTNSHGK